MELNGASTITVTFNSVLSKLSLYKSSRSFQGLLGLRVLPKLFYYFLSAPLLSVGCGKHFFGIMSYKNRMRFILHTWNALLIVV